MQITKTISVKAKWDTFIYPLQAGTPLNMHGSVANNATAVGIVPQTISKKPDADEWLYIMTGGSVDLGEVAYSITEDAIKALSGITFYGADGTPAADPYEEYVLPAATKTALGGVKMAENVADAEGDAPTAAEFKALLDALIAAGIMAEP